MTSPTSVKTRLAALTIVLLMAPVAAATDSEAWTRYQEFVDACQTATSMEQLLPFLPEWRHQRHEASDEDARQSTFERLCKDAKELKDITFVSEEKADAGTVVHMKASWDDFPMKGKVTIVQEDDGLKVEEWMWATGQ